MFGLISNIIGFVVSDCIVQSWLKVLSDLVLSGSLTQFKHSENGVGIS